MCSIEVSMSMSMERVCSSIAMEIASWCARVYNLDENDMLEKLKRDLNIKAIKKEKIVKEKKEVVAKSEFPLPFNGEHDESKCQALRQNNGLYTQCQNVKKECVLFCKQCNGLAEKSEDGVPEYGTIEQRLAVSPFEYTDPKGRRPTAYTKVMKKYNLNIEQVNEEAKKFGVTILEDHFAEPIDTKRGRPSSKSKVIKEPKGAKGRPKKEKKVLQIEDEDEDLFASLVADANMEEEESVMSDLSDKSGKESQKSGAKEAEKAAKEQEKAAKEQEKAEKAAKEQEKAAKEQEKAEKAAKLEAEKLAKEQEKAEKAAKLEAEKAEKAAKLEAEKAAKEQAKAAKEEEKSAKEQEKAEKAAKLEAEKAAEKLAKEQEKAEKTAKKEKKPVAVEEEEEEEEEEETYRKCSDIAGKKYIRSEQTNIVYDLEVYTESQELSPVGKWVGGAIILNKMVDTDSELSDEEIDEE